jgi:hypothetical protein
VEQEDITYKVTGAKNGMAVKVQASRRGAGHEGVPVQEEAFFAGEKSKATDVLR